MAERFSTDKERIETKSPMINEEGTEMLPQRSTLTSPPEKPSDSTRLDIASGEQPGDSDGYGTFSLNLRTVFACDTTRTTESLMEEPVRDAGLHGPATGPGNASNHVVVSTLTNTPPH